MSVFHGNTFIGQRIQVDGHEFSNNIFQNCVLVYGGGPLTMRDNVLQSVRWEFVDSAARTAALLASFYQGGGEGKKFVEFLLSTYGKAVEAPTAQNAGATAGQ